MRSNLSWWILVSVTVMLISAASIYSDAAVVNTKNGSLSGRVIVRESLDRLVVTILTQDKRLFQFYARDVNSVTASKKVLIGVTTPITNEPDSALTPSFILPKGMEVIIIEEKIIKDNASVKKEDASVDNDKKSSPGQIGQKWIKVRAWANVEGWIRSNVLSDSIVFTPEEKAIPLKKAVYQKGMASSDNSKSSVADNPVSVTGINVLQK
jgi:hypothetical protein